MNLFTIVDGQAFAYLQRLKGSLPSLICTDCMCASVPGVYMLFLPSFSSFLLALVYLYMNFILLFSSFLYPLLKNEAILILFLLITYVTPKKKLQRPCRLLIWRKLSSCFSSCLFKYLVFFCHYAFSIRCGAPVCTYAIFASPVITRLDCWY